MTATQERAIAESNASLTARHNNDTLNITAHLHDTPAPKNIPPGAWIKRDSLAKRVLSVLNAAGWKVSPLNSCLVDCPENKDVWSSVQPLHCNDCINGDCVYNLAPRD